MYNDKKLKIKPPFSDRITYTVCTMLCMVFLAIFIYPMLYVVISSVYVNDIFSLDGYKTILKSETILKGFSNSVYYAVTGTLISTTVSILSAYVLTQKNFHFNKVFSTILMVAFNFSGGMLTTYLLVKQLGLINTLWAIVLPSAFSYNSIRTLVSRFNNSLSRELREAAELDGCGHWRYLLRIAIPLTSPSIITIAFFSFVSYWSSYFNARLYLTDRDKYPLSLILNEILLQNQGGDILVSNTSANAIAIDIMSENAVIVLSSLPIMILFGILSKKIKGTDREGVVK